MISALSLISLHLKKFLPFFFLSLSLSMDANQWALANLDHVEAASKLQEQQEGVEKKAKAAQKDCRRCKSTNTKFCYYNNYSLSQPRYFCKTCRRYWTEGGTLRKVPVGGGSRKNKRSIISSSSSSSSSPKKKRLLQQQQLPCLQQQSTYYNQNPNKIHDLNLGYDDDKQSTVTAADVVNYPIFSLGELGKNVEFYPNPNLSFVGTTTTMALNDDGNIVNNNNSSTVFNPLHHEYFRLPQPRFNFCLDGVAGGGGGGGHELDRHDQIGYGRIQQEEASGGILMLQETSTTRVLLHKPYDEVEPNNSKQFTVDDRDRYKEEEEEENKGLSGGGECSGYYWGGW